MVAPFRPLRRGSSGPPGFPSLGSEKENFDPHFPLFTFGSSTPLGVGVFTDLEHSFGGGDLESSFTLGCPVEGPGLCSS